MTVKSRFDLGMKVDKIAGSTVVNGEILFLVTWYDTGFKNNRLLKFTDLLNDLYCVLG